MNRNLLIELSTSGSLVGSVLLEQKEWLDTQNKVTYLDVVDAISDTLYGTEDSDILCESGSGSYTSVLYAYPDPNTLELEVGITYGVLGTGIVSVHDVVQYIQFRLSDEEETQYPIYEYSSSEWLDKTYDSEGNPVSNPSRTVDGSVIKLSRAIYGTLKVVYSTYRYAYGLNIPEREEEVENRFQSVAWCRWSGGATLLELDPPDNAEENAFQANDCKWRSILKLNPDDPYTPPTVEGADETTLIDYCSQEER